jgi:hypothetical protein
MFVLTALAGPENLGRASTRGSPFAASGLFTPFGHLASLHDKMPTFLAA